MCVYRSHYLLNSLLEFFFLFFPEQSDFGFSGKTSLFKFGNSGEGKKVSEYRCHGKEKVQQVRIESDPREEKAEDISTCLGGPSR
mgnify:CR=1 FL=1